MLDGGKEGIRKFKTGSRRQESILQGSDGECQLCGRAPAKQVSYVRFKRRYRGTTTAKYLVDRSCFNCIVDWGPGSVGINILYMCRLPSSSLQGPTHSVRKSRPRLFGGGHVVRVVSNIVSRDAGKDRYSTSVCIG